jgi:hypothetical protein
MVGGLADGMLAVATDAQTLPQLLVACRKLKLPVTIKSLLTQKPGCYQERQLDSESVM